ncbi:MAG: hypothetical protein A2Y94_02075 [Caldithrix sp. RBG_13_44_9]|nr:MAG: hypothetical protein A2Y94_02075 [Caldithrix sp. RBG_13_44_9]
MKKKNKQIFLKEPPEHFYYTNDEITTIVWGISNPLFFIQYKYNMMDINEKKLIGDWLKEIKLKYYNSWDDIILTIIHFYKIEKSKRQEVYSLYREATLIKLDTAINNINKIIRDLKSKNPGLCGEFYRKVKVYEEAFSKLKKERSGELKFFVPAYKATI